MLKKKNMAIKIFTVMLAVLIFFGFRNGFSSTESQNSAVSELQDTAPSVTVLTLKKQNMKITRRFIAEAEAVKVVDLRPQISGYIEEIKFKEGSFVNKGDVLFIIEQAKYEAELLSAKAALHRAQSHLKQQKANYERQKSLHNNKYVSEAALEIAESGALQAQADVETAESEVKLAEINLGYTVVKAPISGHIGQALITEGNYVDTSVESLARIVQLNPIRITFSLTEKERKDLLDKSGINRDVTLQLALSNGQIIPLTEEKMFKDSEVNRKTGTLSVYLDVENPNSLLLPGDYADVIATFDTSDILAVPQTAVSVDGKGSYVFVVDENKLVHRRYVKLGEAVRGLQSVLEGLADEETIVAEGIVKIQDGQKITSIINQ